VTHLKGAVKFRVHVISCSNQVIERSDVHVKRFDGTETIWFLCDAAEEIEKSNGMVLRFHDFEHLEGKRLASTIRNSIAPVSRLNSKLVVKNSYGAS